MPRSLASGRRRVSILSVAPADLAKPTKAELDAGIMASCRILASGYTMGPGTSDTVDEATLCDEQTPKTPTNATWEDGEMTIFRYFDAQGKAETGAAGTPADIGDRVFQAMKIRGTTLWVYDRFTSKKATEEWAEGDECRGFEVVTDAWNTGENEGWIKAVVPMLVQKGEINAVVSAAG